MSAYWVTPTVMHVTTTVPHWPGTHLPIRFQLPTDSRAINATVRVLDFMPMQEGVGMVLQFLQLAPEALTALQQLETAPR